MLINTQISLTSRQTEELAKFCLDVSKLALSTWVLSLFTSRVGPIQIFLFIFGLTFSLTFFIVGLALFKEVE